MQSAQHTFSFQAGLVNVIATQAAEQVPSAKAGVCGSVEEALNVYPPAREQAATAALHTTAMRVGEVVRGNNYIVQGDLPAWQIPNVMSPALTPGAAATSRDATTAGLKFMGALSVAWSGFGMCGARARGGEGWRRGARYIYGCSLGSVIDAARVAAEYGSDPAATGAILLWMLGGNIEHLVFDTSRGNNVLQPNGHRRGLK